MVGLGITAFEHGDAGRMRAHFDPRVDLNLALKIPDRFGFFASGPPRLQTNLGLRFLQFISIVCFNLFLQVLLAVYGILRGASAEEILILVGVSCFAASIFGGGLFWVVTVIDPCREKDYEWPDWEGDGTLSK